ncbi:MAG: domain containing protein [Bacteroidetes bacterium]|jgi:gliding motility-associated-like protein|nr:domain containing protein [Bacteroidota bacterium]
MLPKLFIYSLFLSLSGIPAFAQLSVSPTSNANTLVNNIVGSGVIVTNITLNCHGQASGVFISSGTNIGLSSGIILSTGQVTDAVGPNNSQGGPVFGPNCFDNDASFFDPNILAIEPEATFDGCALEFDIKPVCNILQIDYVFASEEYPEWVGQNNDAFGFFISGPNPAGGNYSGTNIATLPGSSIPIAINNVNANTNSQYFVNNGGGSTIEYDGFTVPLTATADVMQCATYHLKLAIADAKDCDYSSAVFLANKGITCPASQIPQLAASSTPLNCGDDGTATVNVTNGQGPITYNWQPGGQTSATATGLAAGVYTCTVGYTLPCPYTQTISINVTGTNVLTLSTSSENAYCNNNSGSATVSISGGITPYSVPQWSTGQTGATATGLVPGTYTVNVTDASGCAVSKTVAVGNTTPTINAPLLSATQSTCGSANGSILLNAVSGGTAPYTYSWNTTPPATTSDLINVIAGTYSLTITDAQNCTAVKEFIITNSDHVLVDMSFLNEYCDQHNGEIHVPVLNGIPPYTWVWSHSAALNDSVATNLAAGTYSYTVTDNAGCTATGSVILIDIRDDFDGSLYTRPADPTVNVAFTLGIDLPVSWTLDYIELDDGTVRSGATETTLSYPQYGLYDVNFFVESGNGCKDTLPYSIFVKDFMTIYIPNAFTPNNDKKNKVWYVYGTLVQTITIYVYDRWGEKMFETNDMEQGWDGTFKGKLCEGGVYGYKVEATDFFNEEFKYAGHVFLIR